MGNTFTIDKAQLLALLLEAILYGIFLVSFFPCMRVLLWDHGFKPKSMVRWPMVFVAVVLAAIATMDIAYTFLLNLRAFVLYKGPGGSLAVFNDISYWVSVMQSVHVLVSVCIGDAVLIYRCYFVYERTWSIIVIPSILWLAGTACACVIIWIEATLHNSSTLINLHKVQPFLTSFAGLTIAQNIITTTLIVYRIWRVDKATAKYIATTRGLNSRPRRSKLQNVMRIVIESGLLYTSLALVTFVTYISNSSAFYVTTDMEVPVIGIAFNLIIIRADKQSAEEYTMRPTDTISFITPNDSAASTKSADPRSGIQMVVIRETSDDNFHQRKTIEV